MSNVLVEKNKLDVLANAIAGKSGESLKLTLDEMVEAVDGIETGGGGITPTGNIDITQAGVTDVTNYATATVEEGGIESVNVSLQYYTQNNARIARVTGEAMVGRGWSAEGSAMTSKDYNAIPTGTTVTPTESAQTIGGANTMMEGAVTVSAIPSNYVGSGITQRSSTDLTVSGATVTAPSGYYSASASKSVASGTAGTPTATKGTVSNHSVSVTPSVTNTTGYITGGTKSGTAVSVSASELVSGTLSVTSAGTKDVTNYASASIPSGTEGTPTATKGTVTNHSVSVTPSVTNTSGFISGGTKTGTAVTVSASELVSGSETKTENGTYDVTNLAELVVNVSGGGTSTCDTETMTNSNDQATSIQFTGLSGQPKWFFVRCTSQLTRSSSYSYYYVTAVRYNGTNHYGNYWRRSNGGFYNDTTHYSHTYSNGTLTISSSASRGAAGGSFYNGGYELVYVY